MCHLFIKPFRIMLLLELVNVLGYWPDKQIQRIVFPRSAQIWPWSRSKVTVKVTTWYHRKGLVTKNTHAKYQSSTCNSAKVMAKVKVFVTDRWTDGGMRFNCPRLFAKVGDKKIHWQAQKGQYFSGVYHCIFTMLKVKNSVFMSPLRCKATYRYHIVLHLLVL